MLDISAMANKAETASKHPGHKVQLYEEGAFPSPAILEFLDEGLAEKNAVMVIATKENFIHLERSFAERGKSLQDQIEKGDILFKDASQLLPRLLNNERVDRGAFDAILGSEFDNLLTRFPAVTVYSEMVDLLLHDGKIEMMLELEDVWNRFIEDRPINLFFGYHIDFVKPEQGRQLIDQIVGLNNTLVPIQLNSNTPAQHALWIEFIHARKNKFKQQLAELSVIEKGVSRELNDLQTLNRGVIQLHDQQDRWVAHYLNDELAENLAALQMSLASMPTMMKDLTPEQLEPLTAKLQELITLVEGMALSIRSTVDRLHMPLLEEFGLAGALSGFIYNTRSFTRAKITLKTEPEDFRLDPDLEQSVLQVLREAITNAIKHAQAANIEIIVIKSGSRLSCRVTDDGVGFDINASETHMGLPMMRQRVLLLGGSLKLESGPKGSTLQFDINI
jgi:signal transduction histidine kinase